MTMFDFDQWQRVNEEHLSSSLDWLRSRLRSVIDSEEPIKRGKAIADSPTSSDSEYEPALTVLTSRLGLSDFERNVLLLCAALEFDTRMDALCAGAQGDPKKPYPTFALAFSLFADPTWDVLSPDRPLRRLKLIEIDRRAQVPLTASPLLADERAVNYLKGLNHLDERLFLYVSRLSEFSGLDLPPSQQQIVDQIVNKLELCAASGSAQFPVVEMLGAHSEDKQLIVTAVGDQLGVHVYRLAADLIPRQLDALDTLLRLWERECQLVPLALYIEAQSIDVASDTALARLLGRVKGIVFCDCLDQLAKLSPHRSLTVDIAKPTAAEQLSAWREALPNSAISVAKQMVGQFDLNRSAILRLTDLLRNDHCADLDQLANSLWEYCRHNTRPKLDELAQRIECKSTWDDLVLPDQECNLLRQIAAQVRNRGKVLDEWGFRRKVNRGLGVTALFAGESGTGKTMAAEVIANDLQLDLYRIDLSSVINKYIGETEKNLRRLFDAAEGGGAILFFDEADALFGKRSEVKDSHDRFANIEVNYLLQRMESYRGLAILATNNKQALDTAFTRRLRFIVDFRFPDATQRKQIWHRIFPSETPLSGLDYKHLSKLRLTGGSIYNIALNAAFTAAQDRPAIDMPAILDATKSEMIKTQQPINASDFHRSSQGAMS